MSATLRCNTNLLFLSNIKACNPTRAARAGTAPFLRSSSLLDGFLPCFASLLLVFGGEFIEVLPHQPRSVIEPGVFVSFSAERMSAPFEDSESFSQGFYLDS